MTIQNIDKLYHVDSQAKHSYSFTITIKCEYKLKVKTKILRFMIIGANFKGVVAV